MNNSKKWSRILIISVLFSMILMSFVTYAFDPYLYYRFDQNKRFLNNRFVTAGLIKNYDYDTAIIGSSMAQNFSLEDFREVLGYEPIKITIGAMDLDETITFYNLVKAEGKAERYIMTIDLPVLGNDIDLSSGSDKYPDYLYNDILLDDYQYLLGYEVWSRFLPIQVGIGLLDKLDYDLPSIISEKTSIENIATWWSPNIRFDCEILKEMYRNKSYYVSGKIKAISDDKIKQNIDLFIETIGEDEDSEFIIILPPYSALYWVQTIENEYFDKLIHHKKYLVDSLSHLSNVRIVDMQNHEMISDLNHYKDLTHFDLELQHEIVLAIRNFNFDVTDVSVFQSEAVLMNIIDNFIRNNDDWLD